MPTLYYKARIVPYSGKYYLARLVLKHMQGHFRIAYEDDFRSLCTVTFLQKVDFLTSNAC